MKEQEKDKLRDLFQQIELDTPSHGFESRLIKQIHRIEKAKKKKKQLVKEKIVAIIFILVGVASIVLLPALVFYCFTGSSIDIQLPKLEFIHFDFKNINPLLIAIPTSILVLLIVDTLIRKHLSERDHKHF